MVTLEQRQRLSRSIVWKLQRNFFARQGIEAWSKGTVPHHLTSSPFIADAYAKTVLGFLRDCLAPRECDGNSSSTPLDLSQPVYIVELGAGSGRFAYLFLKSLLAIQRNSVLKDIPIKYVMTDFAEKTLEFWRSHGRLQPFIEQGLLDFARFDIEHDRKLKLIHSAEIVSAESLRNPLVVIANYVFDGVPQDAFVVSGGELSETLVSLKSPRKASDLNDPEILSWVEMSYDCNRINGNYYDDAKWNRLLLDYKKRLPDTTFLFPTAALDCLENLRCLSGENLLLLSGDRGFSNDDALKQGKGAPALAVHGSVSMMVDYQILGEYCRLKGGQVMHPSRCADSLNISAFVFGHSPTEFAETRHAYAEAIEKFGPDDFFTLKSGIEDVYESLSLDQLVAFLRLSRWDYKRFWECLPTLKRQIEGSTDIQKQELHKAIVKVWDSYLPIGEENDLAFELGTLVLEMGFSSQALEFFQHSIDLYGMAPGTAYNMGVCYYNLEQMEQALENVNRALQLEAGFDAAEALRKMILSAVPDAVRKTRQRAAR